MPHWLPFLAFGVSTTLKKAAGREAFQELAEQGPLPLGGAVLTGPGRLRKKGIIHVAAVDLLGRASEASLRKSAGSAMEIVNRLDFRSIAFPVLGAGATGGMDEQDAYEILTDALMKIPSFAEVRIVRARAAKNRSDR
jgi:O-acetyl-ADP-ribose deacetylase (regulator of RNase III)